MGQVPQNQKARLHRRRQHPRMLPQAIENRSVSEPNACGSSRVPHRRGPMVYFENSLQHLLAELERIDLLIVAQVAYARRLHADDEQFHGLSISEEEVYTLLRQ